MAVEGQGAAAAREEGGGFEMKGVLIGAEEEGLGGGEPRGGTSWRFKCLGGTC